MRICLVGGTFDPPHWGHLLLAESVRDLFSIEKIVFIPAFIPPHKQDEKLSDHEHRVNMLRLLVDENPGFALDTREIDRQGISYSIDTVRKIKAEKELTSEDIGFLMGADNFVDLDSWKESDALVAECQILVAARPDVPMGEATQYTDLVTFVDLPKIEISSTMIRNRVRNGKSIRYYVLPSVADYIHKHKLYQ